MKLFRLGLFFSLIFISVAFIWGCEKNSEYQFVNFSEKAETRIQGSSMPETKTLHVAVAAMISPKETIVYYEELLRYIGKQIDYEIVLVQRKTYSEVNELFPKRLIDLAFVCSGPYANDKSKYGFEGLATPIVRGKPYYQSYLIVQKNSLIKTLEDLRGKIFAFTDPDSNTGTLVPRFWLYEKNETPSSFFNRIIYTYSHDNSILAVAKGLVDGATVDGHKWEFYNAKNPYFTSKTRVIKKSDYFGSPPLVASSFLNSRLKSRIQNVILLMHKTEDGKKILENLMVDRFELPKEEWYENVRRMQVKVLQKQ
ncbi:MAG: phosphate/phosphite/phosphonate ABC transporter substrate-binding protein [Desulfobacula sp.]|nr:phosphate/phosphite/phosphonate ABC transporter substrate-binding protein [Desulfobacula sp.]